MGNYGQWFSLCSTTVVNRRQPKTAGKKITPKSKSTLTKSSLGTINSEKIGKSSYLKTEDSSKQRVTWIKINNILTISVVSGLLLILFYIIPWEHWIFSEQELLRLSGNDQEFKNYLATSEQQIDDISIHQVPCFEKAYWREKKLNVLPERCGVMLTDDLLPEDQTVKLRELTNKLIDKIGDSSHTNRESINLQWINLHNLFKRNFTRKVLEDEEYDLIRNASIAAREAVSTAFGLPADRLYYNLVSQFTRYRPLVKHNEFRHVDKVRSPALIVTSILWLSTANLDFGGGQTEFLNGPGPEPFSPVLVDPKMGRFAAWTSGYENPHEVTELFWGNRLALIFAFTVSNTLGYETIDALREYAINNNQTIKKTSY